MLASAVLLAAACAGAAVAAASHASAGPRLRSDQKVVICHATGNGKWVRIAPSGDAVLNGYAGHPADIIPPFDYVLANGTTGTFPGLNWDAEGQGIYQNDCVPPNPTRSRSTSSARASTYMDRRTTRPSAPERQRRRRQHPSGNRKRHVAGAYRPWAGDRFSPRAT